MKYWIFTGAVFFTFLVKAQDSDSLMVKQIFNKSLTSNIAYDQLKALCELAPHRLAGSTGSFKALAYIESYLKTYKPDSIYHQNTLVHPWERGNPEEAYYYSKNKNKQYLKALAIGGSVATGEKGVSGNIIEVKGLKQLVSLGKNKIEGKIVFFNEAMEPTLVNPSEAYGKAGYQRVNGAIEASRYGAKAVVVRSLTNIIDDNPHTGIMRYADTLPKIPAITISTKGADELAKELESNPGVELYFKTNCSFPPDTMGYNLVAEIKGAVYPDEIITVGAHIDGWDAGQGANDDGAGVIHVLEILRMFKIMGIKPNRTIRFVFFIDEEMWQVGAAAYYKQVKARNEKLYAAFESDSGGQYLFGFGCLCNESQMKAFKELGKYFVPYGIDKMIPANGDVDIYPLKEFGIPLLNTRPNMQRYFEYHHSAADVFSTISLRELQLTTGAITSFIYLIDHKNTFAN